MTGVLPVALGRACKLSDYFMHKDKTYVGIMHLHKDIPIKILQKIIGNEFTGKIKQLPPKRSKVKRQERVREIKKFEILEKEGKDVLFLAEVEAGTYIRKLVHQVGEKIGGAHMTELRRTKAGIFSEQDREFVNLYRFKEAVEEYKEGKEEKLRSLLIPAEIISEMLPIVQVKEKAVKQLLTGKPVFKQDVIGKLPKEEKFVVFFKDKLIEVARKTKEENEKESKGDIIARPEFVMQPPT